MKRQWIGVLDPEQRARLAAGVERPLLPLTDAEALERAMLLRTRFGLSCAAISAVMGLYHGQWATPDGWRHRLLVAGGPKRPFGGGNGIGRRRR